MDAEMVRQLQEVIDALGADEHARPAAVGQAFSRV
jgi:hypothetical protein